MKKISLNLLLLLLSIVTLSSCEKEEPNFNVGSKFSIIFDDAINKTTADYIVGSTITLKVGAAGASTVNVISNYTTGTVRTVNLGSFPVTNGVATITIPANSLRADADGAPIGAGTAPASSRGANTYTLTVEAVGGGTTERRFFTAVLVR
ncbi:hypothetical protein [Hymenobacter sp. IS2118]|uniref:hypothetical protein n=1 Tax=Hymenobacter sp. IS2118 TaxID=1505605 RepID=UPI00054ECBFE|nr:hypothetical protein [Hymenobacter sp. IS2118]